MRPSSPEIVTRNHNVIHKRAEFARKTKLSVHLSSRSEDIKKKIIIEEDLVFTLSKMQAARKLEAIKPSYIFLKKHLLFIINY